MPTFDPTTAAWWSLADPILGTLGSSVGNDSLRFVSYRVRNRSASEPETGMVARPPLYEGVVSVEGHRYRAEYAVHGWKLNSGRPVEVEAMPLTWEDNGNHATSPEELGSLTRAVLEAHRLITGLLCDQ